MIPSTPPAEAPDCRFAPIFGGRRIGPSTFAPSYQLVLNGTDHLYAALLDVATWGERIHRASLVRAEVLRVEQEAAMSS